MTSAYRIDETYDWNYAHAPAPPSGVRVPDAAGSWDFCGLPIASPLGVPAGPLLNSGWILYYAALGFDVLTYKTVRSTARASYGLPNLLPVRSAALSGIDAPVVADSDARDFDSWAISFGMPSRDPDVWQRDVAAACEGLAAGKVLVVSVVASPESGWTIDRIASDFATCARMARDAGAHAIEANLSCPNVCTQEGGLYQSPDASGIVAAAVRDAIGRLPLVLKVGLFDDRDQAAAFIGAVRGSADAISGTNTIATRVKDSSGIEMFEGQRRGIGGRAIGPRCLEEMAMLARLVAESGATLRLIGVGGIASAADVESRIRAGAHHVQIATAAMLDPTIAIQIRQALAAPSHVR
jgi:dihydroorotate dehydrogenase (NAD+) catalytic subunit